MEVREVEGSTQLTMDAGRLAAENLDLRLRLVETRERLLAICGDALPDQKEVTTTPPRKQYRIDPLEDNRNRRLLLEHLTMCRAIASSLPWRVVEFAARPISPQLHNPAATITEEDVRAIDNPFEIRRRLDETGEYLVRVLNSRKWRLIQKFRGIFRRRW